jgi:hypothetical protein
MRDVKSYPADDLSARDPQLAIVPSGKTQVSDRRFSRIVPYFTAVVPEAPQAILECVWEQQPRDECVSKSMSKILHERVAGFHL